MTATFPTRSLSLAESPLAGDPTSEALFPPDRVSVMAVLNLTPDSFSDGGALFDTSKGVREKALSDAARSLRDAGAALLDVGGESTRPGAKSVSAAEEIRRVETAIAQISEEIQLPVSIDTQKAEVARRAVSAGAAVINDVSGLATDPEVADVAAETGAILILGHMRGTPRNMQHAPRYEDVLVEVASELEASVERARSAGIPSGRLVVDPGIGFGKRLEDNLELIAHAGWLRGRLNLPVLVGPSRKAFIGELTGDSVEDRDAGTLAACTVAAFSGADAIRVHDAAGARRAAIMGRALRDARRKDHL
ncbi:MAG: dihydropteroate synthase [Myxococcota bacterium]|nr:dihydropteroate synthase [Myxococcota bacterium]